MGTETGTAKVKPLFLLYLAPENAPILFARIKLIH